jgi:Mn2+/Fe2+ NRAMP family transporter
MFGYAQLWLALFATPFMIAVQEMCGRIGLVTGKGLGTVLRENYSKKILWGAVALLAVANTVNIGADLGAMASATQMITKFPFVWALIFLTTISLGLQIAVPYPRYAPFLKILAFSLLAYVVTVFLVPQDWTAIARSTLMPTIGLLDTQHLMNIVAILGTTISPYLFFWQADEEVEEEISRGWLSKFGSWIRKEPVGKAEIRSMRQDTVTGMIFSNLIMFFIIATAASTLAKAGITQIDTAEQAAKALMPLAGNFAGVIFAIGIIGTGLLVVPILAGSTAYALAEAWGWNEGLSLPFRNAKAFYGVISVSMVIGALLNFAGIAPFRLLYLTAVLNGVMAPPLIVLIVLMAGNKKIMGASTSGKLSETFGWATAVLMGGAAIALFWAFVQ